MKSNSPTRIMIVDDHLVVRMGLSAMLSFEPDFELVAEAEDGEEAVALAESRRPDLIIMDLLLPKLNGAQAAQRILARQPEIKILILTTYDTSVELHTAVKAGVAGAVVKTSNQEDLIDSIRRILGGERVISPEIAHTLACINETARLTPRQTEILELASRGYSNDNIGTALNISVNSVKDHLKQIYAKLNVSTRAEATSRAIKLKLIAAGG